MIAHPAQNLASGNFNSSFNGNMSVVSSRARFFLKHPLDPCKFWSLLAGYFLYTVDQCTHNLLTKTSIYAVGFSHARIMDRLAQGTQRRRPGLCVRGPSAPSEGSPLRRQETLLAAAINTSVHIFSSFVSNWANCYTHLRYCY